jgi:putative inorganic carbon (hco3(-)) transporter
MKLEKTSNHFWGDFDINQLLPLLIIVFASLFFGLAVYRFSWKFSLGLVGAIGYGLICLRYPIVLLFLIIYVTPFQSTLPDSFKIGGGLNAYNLLLFSILGVWIVNGIIYKKFPRLDHPISFVILIFWIMLIFSFVRTSTIIPDYDISDAAAYAKRWLFPMLVFFPLAFSTFTKKDINKIMWAFFVVLTIMLFTSLDEYRETGATISSFDWAERPGGPFVKGAANDLAAFFVYYSSVLLGWLIYEKKIFSKLTFIAIFSISLIMIMITYSRGSYIGILGAIVTIGLLKNRLIVFFVLLLAFSYKFWAPSGVEERVEMTSRNLVDDRQEIIISPNSFERNFEPSTANRLVVWRGALEMIKEKPILDFGFLTFNHFILNYAQLAKPMDTHNMYLRVLSELGIIGLSVFLSLWIVPFIVAFKIFKKAKEPMLLGISLGIIAAIVGISLVNVWGSRFFREELVGLYWILLGVMVRLSFIEKENQTSSLSTS